MSETWEAIQTRPVASIVAEVFEEMGQASDSDPRSPWADLALALCERVKSSEAALAAAESDRDVAESRKSRAFLDLKTRAEAAEARLADLERLHVQHEAAALARLAEVERALAEERERADSNFEAAQRIRAKYSDTVNRLAEAHREVGRFQAVAEAEIAERRRAVAEAGALSASLAAALRSAEQARANAIEEAAMITHN